MIRYLFAVFPVSGHVNPGLPIARELVARGHDVRWYSTQRFRRAIEATGARWVPFRAATPIDEEWLPEQFPGRPSGGIAQLQFDIEHEIGRASCRERVQIAGVAWGSRKERDNS